MDELNLSLDNEKLTTENMIESSINELPENVPGITDHFDAEFQQQDPAHEKETISEPEKEVQPENNPFNEADEIPESDQSNEDSFEQTAEMLMNSYNVVADQYIKPRLVIDMANINNLLFNNKDFDTKTSQNLISNCEQINEAIGQVAMLEDSEKKQIKVPLIKVLKKHSFKVNNPYIELVFACSVVAMNKISVIKQLQSQQNLFYQKMIFEIKELNKKKETPVEINIAETPKRKGLLKRFLPFLFRKRNEN